ncbi:Aminopeptidase P,Peptidase M24 [Cinara cedri]|uniref:Aminopeptidase P,Peptidase M24 n=1 Tax=Cinara cedri TaxID=506608 RepID=A0A5E4MU45_9HEMI|nr:Aminopeptidase P,Peptidase M24 [Cinara cedri]
MLTCSKIIFRYEKNSPFLLELHTGEQKAKELKKQIEEEKIHSCKVNEGVLVVEFDGKVYRNDKLYIAEQLEHFSCANNNPSEVFCQSEQQSAPEQESNAQGDKAGKRVQFSEEVEMNIFFTNTSDSLTSTNDSPSSNNEGQNPPHEPPSNTDCNTSIYCPLGLFTAGCLAMAGGAVLCFADRPDIGGILMASAIVCLLIVGIAKLCEKVSEKKQKDPDISTSAAVKREVQESTAEYLDVFEECSSASTTKLPSEIEFRKRSNEAVLLTDINSISWLLNIRNENANYTPHVLCRAILYENGNVDLFIQDDKIEVALDNHINVFNISELENALHKLNSIIIDPNTIPISIVNLLKNKQIIEREDPCLLSKAIKNKTEIAGAINAHIQDAIAVTDFLYWFENNVNNGITELDAEKKILEYRKEPFNENAAIIHYRASSSTNKIIQERGLYLIDSGGQYLNGTTDVTRTVAIGTPTKEQITHYTIVLKAHIAIASAVFPPGTTGGELDILVRAHLWKFGMDYMHGTGHGVGSYLSVHEGPQEISKGNKVELVPGMIVSNEPGYYIPNKYGIRIENLI